MLWKNKKESAAMVAGMSGVWLMVEVLDYHLITLICHLLIILMLLLFLWKKLAFLPVPWYHTNTNSLIEINLKALNYIGKYILFFIFIISNGVGVHPLPKIQKSQTPLSLISFKHSIGSSTASFKFPMAKTLSSLQWYPQ